MNLTLTIPNETTFKLPEGQYQAVIAQCKLRPADEVKGTEPAAILLFEVDVPGLEDFKCMARKVLPPDLSRGSPLRRFLEGLLGPAYFTERSNQQVDLQAELAQRRCEVLLIHANHDAERFDFPRVDVHSIRPILAEADSF